MIKCSHALSFSNEKEQSKFNDSFSKNSSFHSIFFQQYMFFTQKNLLVSLWKDLSLRCLLFTKEQRKSRISILKAGRLGSRPCFVPGFLPKPLSFFRRMNMLEIVMLPDWLKPSEYLPFYYYYYYFCFPFSCMVRWWFDEHWVALWLAGELPVAESVLVGYCTLLFCTHLSRKIPPKPPLCSWPANAQSNHL